MSKRPIQKEPYPPGFRDALAKETRLDVRRIATRDVKIGQELQRPTVEMARWIATAAMTDRVQGARPRLFLAEQLRYLVKVDLSPPTRAEKLTADDMEWVRHVAGQLVTPKGTRRASS